MITNDQRYLLSFGSSMEGYLSLAQEYFEMACEVVHLNKNENELSMNSYMLYVFISYDYVYC